MLNKKEKITNLLGEGVISNPIFFSTKLIVGTELKEAFFFVGYVYEWW